MDAHRQLENILKRNEKMLCAIAIMHAGVLCLSSNMQLIFLYQENIGEVIVKAISTVIDQVTLLTC